MIKHAFIKQTNKVFQYGETDQDKPKPYGYGYNDYTLKDWVRKASTWYDVSEDDEEAFRELAWIEYCKDPIGKRIDQEHFNLALSKGIEIPLGLVELKAHCNNESCPQKGCCSDCSKPIFIPYIIKQKEESQDKYEVGSWREVIEMVKKFDKRQDQKYLIEDLKQIFTIKRL